MSRVALAAFARRLTIEIPKLTDAQGKKLLVDKARQVNSEILQQQTTRAGVVPDYIQVVNGQRDAPLESVTPTGVVIFLYDYRREIALVAHEALVRNSPRRSGAYIQHHIYLVDGREVASLPQNLRSVKEIVLTNDQPYARRLEVGKKHDGSPFVVQVEPHIYERTARKEIAPVYRNVADVQFNYVDLSGAYVTRSRGKRVSAGTAIRYPAIFIRPL